MKTHTHTEQELQLLKREVNAMWQLVLSQLEKARQAFVNRDQELAHEVLSREKRVDVYELKIESDCENYIALYSPVAVDLRLILSLMKICNTLERIGDFASGIARYVVEEDCVALPNQLLEELRLDRMFATVQEMLSDSYVALETENTKLSGRILSQDDTMNQLYHAAPILLAQHLTQYPTDAYCALKLFLLIRKLERIGDHCSNIVEEIVFYVDAKILKHRKVQKELEER